MRIIRGIPARWNPRQQQNGMFYLRLVEREQGDTRDRSSSVFLQVYCMCHFLACYPSVWVPGEWFWEMERPWRVVI